MTDILFNVNSDNVRLHSLIPKHGRAEDAARSAELQFRNAHILPIHAAAVLLGEEGGVEVERAFFVSDPPVQRFWGIEQLAVTAEFKGRHVLRIDQLGEVRVTLVDKIKLRFEGGPQRLIWADFSVHVEDPDAEEMAYFHEMLNRDVKVILTQSADLVDEMRAKAQGMAVSDVTPPSGDLPFGEGGAEQLQQAADELSKPRKKRSQREAA